LTERVTYADGRTEERAVKQVEFKPGDAPVTRVTWEGGLRIQEPNEYEPRTEGGLQMFLEGQPWAERRYLGRGMYPLRAEWNGEGKPKFEWRITGGKPLPLPPGTLFRVVAPRNGLLAGYYNNEKWEGDPLIRQIVPFLLFAWTDQPPIQPGGPFSARFTGALRVTEPGSYRFRIIADDGARLSLDDKVLAEALEPGQEQIFEVTTDLSKGDHPIVIDYFQQGVGSSLRLYWQKGDAPFVLVPPDALVPPVSYLKEN
jgi:hypothetical protein